MVTVHHTAERPVQSIADATLKEIIAAQEEIFVRRQPNSAHLAEAAQQHLAGGVTSSWQITAPQPVWLSHGHGSKVYDVDGNEYVDLHGGYGAALAGHGHPAIGAWGRQVRMGPDVVAVRQNLSLIVDGGVPVPGLSRSSSMWGATVANKVFVWRSGLGITASGALVYAGGKGLSVNTLADVLRRAGALRAMELDINTHFVNYFTYSAAPAMDADAVTGSKLVKDMTHDSDRYFRRDQRDFVALFAA